MDLEDGTRYCSICRQPLDPNHPTESNQHDRCVQAIIAYSNSTVDYLPEAKFIIETNDFYKGILHSLEQKNHSIIALVCGNSINHLSQVFIQLEEFLGSFHLNKNWTFNLKTKTRFKVLINKIKTRNFPSDCIGYFDNSPTTTAYFSYGTVEYWEFIIKKKLSSKNNLFFLLFKTGVFDFHPETSEYSDSLVDWMISDFSYRYKMKYLDNESCIVIENYSLPNNPYQLFQPSNSQIEQIKTLESSIKPKMVN
jgi:hypothetical protein